jgi:hypothetical protein
MARSASRTSCTSAGCQDPGESAESLVSSAFAPVSGGFDFCASSARNSPAISSRMASSKSSFSLNDGYFARSMCRLASRSVSGSHRKAAALRPSAAPVRSRPASHQILRQPSACRGVAGLRRCHRRVHDLAPLFQRNGIQQHAHVVGFGASMGEGAFDVTLFFARHTLAFSATDSVSTPAPRLSTWRRPGSGRRQIP